MLWIEDELEGLEHLARIWRETGACNDPTKTSVAAARIRAEIADWPTAFLPRMLDLLYEDLALVEAEARAAGERWESVPLAIGALEAELLIREVGGT